MADRSLVRTDVPVGGMTCAACASRIQSQLADLDGVTDALVNFAAGTATVRHDDRVDEDDVRSAIAGLGYSSPEAERSDERRREHELQRRWIIALLLGAPVVLVSMVPALQFDGWEWVAGLLTTPVVFWAGWSFHRSALRNLRHHAATMDTLVSLGTTAAWTWSTAALVLDDGHVYYETAVVIVVLILLGKWLEVRATRRSGDAIRALADLSAPTAILVDGTEISRDQLEVGMRFRVRPGDKVATDGCVVEGHAAVDASMITGEPVPVEVGPGDTVVGATINTDGSLVVEATAVGAATALAQIVQLVERAQGSRANVQRLADRVAGVFVPVAIAIAAIALATWLATGAAASDAVTAAVAVLIIACPCALGLATPLGIMVGTGRGAQLGVIIKGGEVLEDSRRVDTIVLDKTGTVTEGRMRVVDTTCSDEVPAAERDELLVAVAAVEAHSEHPIARAVARIGDGSHGPVAEDFISSPGRGVSATVSGQRIDVGRRAVFREVPASIEAAARSYEQAGRTAVFGGRDGTAEVALAVADVIKPTSPAAIAAFHELGLTTTLLTGDNAATAAAVGEAVGIDEVIAEVLPEDKDAQITTLQQAGQRVAMVGDGINDAPALARADLGIAVGTGTDVAIEASDLTVVSGDLLGVADAIALARRTLSTIRGNLFWAFAYNTAAIPLAAFGVLNPMIAAAAMGLSSLFVVSNSLRLRNFSGYRGSVSRGGAASSAPSAAVRAQDVARLTDV
ncbi:MAG: heavy metal translocating P-type ATPase [Actinomycetota bacterium]